MLNIALAVMFCWFAFDSFSHVDPIASSGEALRNSGEYSLDRVLQFTQAYREVFLALLAAGVFAGKFLFL